MKPAGYVALCILICHQISQTSASGSNQYTIKRCGAKNTKEFKMYFLKGNDLISPVHDIPLYADENDKIFNMVVEIPRWTHAKMEMNMKETLNPITQDIKDGNLRYVSNVFPYYGYIWNYGAIPQTWERPITDTRTHHIGDNDPIDVIEIGEEVAEMGSVIQVKVLGSLALIDGGETDWKVIVINVKDPKAKLVNDISHLAEHFPGVVEESLKWFKNYKVPCKGPRNTFEFNDQPQTKDETLKVIDEMHKNWIKLTNEEVDIKDRNCKRTSTDKLKNPTKSKCKMDGKEVETILKSAKKAEDPKNAKEAFAEVDKVHYVSQKAEKK